MNNTKLVCIRNTTSNEHLRIPRNKADILVSMKGFEYLSKRKFKEFINSSKM